MKNFLQRWLINTVAVLVASYIVSGIHYDTTAALVVATLVLGILNTVIRPVLILLVLPLVVLTVGIILLIINALLLYWVGRLVHGFHVETFGAAVWGSVVMFLVSLVLNSLTRTGDTQVWMRRGGPRRPNRPRDDDTGSGPVIDV